MTTDTAIGPFDFGKGVQTSFTEVFAMNKERLLKLAEFLKSIPDNKFDLSEWRASSDIYAHVDDKDLWECGTTACAVGWACAIPEFQEQGLYYAGCDVRYQGPQNYTTYYTSWGAVEKFFGITFYEAQDLFSRYSYDDMPSKFHREAVIKRIEKFCSSKT